MTDHIDDQVTFLGEHYTAGVHWDKVIIDETWRTGLPERHLTDDQLDALPTVSLTLIHRTRGTQITFGFGDSLTTIIQTYIDAAPRSPFTALDMLEQEPQ